MKIISEFHDYYDIALGYGSESDLRYIRKKEGVPLERFHLTSAGERPWLRAPWKQTFRQYTVGFCGKCYPVLFVTEPGIWEHSYGKNALTLETIADLRRTAFKTNQPIHGVFIHTLEKVDEYAEKHLKKDLLKEYWEGHKARRWWNGRNRKPTRTLFEEYFDSFKDYKPLIWEKYPNVPVWLIDDANYKYDYKENKVKCERLILNACLRDCEFQRVVEPYVAFQELMMTVSNMAKPEPYVPVPSDKDMVEIKGFDPKWSFRKPPQK